MTKCKRKPNWKIKNDQLMEKKIFERDAWYDRNCVQIKTRLIRAAYVRIKGEFFYVDETENYQGGFATLKEAVTESYRYHQWLMHGDQAGA